MIDFGMAKALDQRLTEQTLLTELGRLVGTLIHEPRAGGDRRPGHRRRATSTLGVCNCTFGARPWPHAASRARS